jgi:uncharacterized damage-inducible protein DinB
MITTEYLQCMANYNQWMNQKLYAAAATLSIEEFIQDKGAFFKSILGTLNHLVVADTIWLKRFASCGDASALAAILSWPQPAALNDLALIDFAALRQRREELDTLIKNWTSRLTDNDLSAVLSYTNMQGEAMRKPLRHVLVHFFNHQTHHRGQATTLLTQSGVDVGATDLLLLMPNVD